jgi:hypothetical protein
MQILKQISKLKIKLELRESDVSPCEQFRGNGQDKNEIWKITKGNN